MARHEHLGHRSYPHGRGHLSAAHSGALPGEPAHPGEADHSRRAGGSESYSREPAQCDRPDRSHLAALPIREHHDKGQQPGSALTEGEGRPYWHDGRKWCAEVYLATHRLLACGPLGLTTAFFTP